MKAIPLTTIVLRAGLEPESQYAYAEEAVSSNNSSGFLGRVVDIAQSGDKHYVTVKLFVQSRYIEETHITTDLVYHFEDDEMCPIDEGEEPC